jgi:hypothetical protein
MRAVVADAEGSVARDGIEVRYARYGSGTPTVLLLPTWSLVHSRHWKFQVPYLARHFRVLTLFGEPLYAYERQVPRVATSKIDGLKQHYGISDGPALSFFIVHGVLDVEHSDAEREMLGVLAAEADPAPIEQATREALDAWWNFLSAVDMPATEPAAASA